MKQDKAFRTVDPNLYEHLPETRGLAWEDDFFDTDGCTEPSSTELSSSVVAVFDFDYDLVAECDVKAAKARLLLKLLFLPPWGLFCAIRLPPWRMVKVIQENARSRHVAVTRDGITYVRTASPACCCPGSKGGNKIVHTILFDDITDCSVSEPSPLLPSSRPLRSIRFTIAPEGGDDGDGSSASRGSKRHSELALTGLKDPDAFARLVSAMKRGHHATVLDDDAALDAVVASVDLE
jgi:hypothetical protein